MHVYIVYKSILKHEFPVNYSRNALCIIIALVNREKEHDQDFNFKF